MASTPAPTGTGSTGEPEATYRGRVSGAVLRAIRESTGLTQTGLANATEMDPETVRSWETGRRPLARMPVSSYHRFRRKMQRLRPDAARLALLDDALNADTMLTDMLETQGDPADHPLATQVTDRALTDLLAWPLRACLVWILTRRPG